MNIENFLPINLPSRCLVYNGVIPEDIKIRAYRGIDEMYLSEINPTNLHAKFIPLLKGLVIGVEPREITIGDLQYIIVWEYAKSYTNIVKIPTKCSYCMKDIEAMVDFADLDVVTLSNDSDWGKQNGFKQPFEKTLPSGKKVNLRLLTIGDEVDAQIFEVENEDGMLFRYAKSIVDTDDILQRIGKLKDFTIDDLTSIRAFHDEYYHGPNMNAKFKCLKCGKEDRVEVPFRFSFIYPRGSELRRYFGKGVSPVISH